VEALARAARVVATTVGPYRRLGLALVEACARAGTDYADLSGGVLFFRDSIDRYHQMAAGNGSRIVLLRVRLRPVRAWRAGAASRGPRR
jgi:trans enoyl reductase